MFGRFDDKERKCKLTEKTDRDKEGERAATSERKIWFWLDLLVDQTRLKTDVSVLTFIPD